MKVAGRLETIRWIAWAWCIVHAASPAAAAPPPSPPCGESFAGGLAAAAPPPPESPAPKGEVSIVIDTRTLRLTVYDDGKPFRSFPVAIGRAEPYRVTPIGEWQIIRKDRDWGGGFGTRWLGLNVPWGIYGIHGTNKPWAIGTRASAGCIRMLNRDVELLYEWVRIGTPVTIVGEDPYVTFSRPLENGSSGRDVVAVQLRMKAMGFFHGTAAGRFDAETDRAVRRLQRTYALPVDGKVWGDVLRVLGLRS